MTRGKGVNDSRRRRTQSTHNGTRCPPPPLIPCENAYEHADMPPAPPPPPPPLMMRAAPGGHRPPPGFCRPAEGGRPRPFKRPYSPVGRGRRHGDRDDCDQQRRQVRHRGDWDGPGFDGGPPGPVRVHPRGGGNNDGGRPPSPPRVPFGAPPCPTRGPPFAPNHCGPSAGRLPAGRPAGRPRFPQHPPSRGRGYRSCSPPRLPRPLPPGPPPSPPRHPPHFRGGTDDYRPRNLPRQPWGPPPGPPTADWGSPRGGDWDRPWDLPRHPPGPPPGWRWAPPYEAWGDDQPPVWECAPPATLWRSPDARSPWRVDQCGGPAGTQDFQWVLTRTPARSTSAPWTWWHAPSQPLRQPTPSEPPSRPVYMVQGTQPSLDPTYELVPVPRRPPQLFPAHPPPPYRL